MEKVDMGSSLPVYDLEELVAGREDEENFRECLKKLGIFRIINHGILEKVLDETDKACRELFDMPVEKKLQYGKSHDDAYIANQPAMRGHEKISIPKALGISYFCKTMWPDLLNSSSRDALEEYVCKMKDISEAGMRVLLRTFGVEKYYETIFSRHNYRTRLNYFHQLKEEKEEFITLPEHTDTAIITILKIDSTVGGFQFFCEESAKWINVPAMPSCIIVLLGDTFRAWSNGRTPNAKHRVLAKGPQQARVTIAHFCHFPSDTEGMHLKNLLTMNIRGSTNLSIFPTFPKQNMDQTSKYQALLLIHLQPLSSFMVYDCKS